MGGYRIAVDLLGAASINPSALSDCVVAQVYRETLAGFLAEGVEVGGHVGCGTQVGSRHLALAARHAQGADVGHGLFADPSSQIELVWKSVQARYRHFQLRERLCVANQYSSWV